MSTHQTHHVKKSETETETAASSTGAAEALKLLDQVVAALALPAQTLTAKQRKAATRSRKGMERVIPTLATLSIEHGVSVPKQPTSTMTSTLEQVTQLEAVQQKLTGILATVGNNVDASRSTSTFAIREHPHFAARKRRSPKAMQGRLETAGFEGTAGPA